MKFIRFLVQIITAAFQSRSAWVVKMVNLDQMRDRESDKKKKKKRKQAEEAAQQADYQPTEVTEVKKKKQKLAEETEEQAQEAEYQPVEVTEPKKKKQKKMKAIVDAEEVKDNSVSAEKDETPAESPFKKDFYKMQAATEAVSKKAVKEYRQLHNITLYGKGRKVFKPLFTFAELGFPPAIMNICQQFQKPSPIQVPFF